MKRNQLLLKTETRRQRSLAATMRSSLAFAVLLVLSILDAASCVKYYKRARVNRKCECGISGEGISNRIVGGEIVVPHIFPWLAAIFLERELHCGGALINDRYILTAGHCVRWVDHSLLDVGLGMHDIKNPKIGYIVPIDRVILHDHFESDFLHDTNDISLIRLKYPVKYSERIRPICLPVKGSDYTGHKVKVAGWGRVTKDGGASRYLRKATLRVMPWLNCRNISFGDHLTESMICAYADNTDACQGDSGGPLMYERPNGQHEVIGIVSWGIGCALPSSPGVYVKNTDYLNWIKGHTSDAIYCMNKL